MEMICQMHEAEPYGPMLVNSKRISRIQMAALVGVLEKDRSAQQATGWNAGARLRAERSMVGELS